MMNDLPLYPTPRQAAYVVPPQSHHDRPGHVNHHGSSSSHRKKSAPSSQHVNYKSNMNPSTSHQSTSHQPVQQVHFPSNQPHPSQAYYQHPGQSYSSPTPGPSQSLSGYYQQQQQPNNLSAAPTPQQSYYQSQPPPQPPVQAPQHQPSYHRPSPAGPGAPTPQPQIQPQPSAPPAGPPVQAQYMHHHHSPVSANPVPVGNEYLQAPVQQRYESNAIKKPPPQPTPPMASSIPMGPSSSRVRSKDSLNEANGSKSSSKQKLENELRAVFDKVDYNNSGKISKTELSNALLNFDHTKFQDSTITLMINLFSSSSNSKHLNFDQFVSLWKYLSAYKKLFIQADTNNSGDISFGEFQKILEQIGYKLNIDLVLHLFQKFSYKSFDQDNSIGTLKFDKFIELLVYLRKLTDIFKKYDKDLSGVATINFSDFLFEVSNLN